MRGFCEQRLNDETNFPKQLLLESFDRKQKHRYQPNGKYVNNKLEEAEPGFRYADRQFKDYERTLKFMDPWLQELAGRDLWRNGSTNMITGVAFERSPCNGESPVSKETGILEKMELENM